MKQHKQLPVASKKDMKQAVAKYYKDSGESESDEVTAWHHQEELYVGQPATVTKPSVHSYLRPVAFMSAISAFVFTLVLRSHSLKKVAICTASRKDLFV